MNTLREKLEKMEVAIAELKEAIKMEVKPDLLSGKVAIETNSEREFKLLMEHYQAKGWKSKLGNFPTDTNVWFFISDSKDLDNIFSYENEFKRLSHNQDGFKPTELNYKIIPFSDFAAEVGIKVPVFVMTSEDGAPLYEGDEYHCAYSINGWRYKGKFNAGPIITPIGYPNTHKAFSTYDAAESWIQEQNKPKSIEVKLHNAKTANVHTDLIKIFDGNNSINISPSDLEDMLHAYKTISKS